MSTLIKYPHYKKVNVIKRNMDHHHLHHPRDEIYTASVLNVGYLGLQVVLVTNVAEPSSKLF